MGKKISRGPYSVIPADTSQQQRLELAAVWDGTERRLKTDKIAKGTHGSIKGRTNELAVVPNYSASKYRCWE